VIACSSSARIPEPGAKVGNAALEVSRAAEALFQRLSSITVLLLDLTVGPLLLARAQRHWMVLPPDSLLFMWPFFCWALVYYLLGKCMTLFDVYRVARGRRVATGYKLMNVDEPHAH
jgi:hypothetical protein